MGSVAADIVMFSLVLREFVSFVKRIRKNYAEMALGKHIFRYKIWQECCKLRCLLKFFSTNK